MTPCPASFSFFAIVAEIGSRFSPRDRDGFAIWYKKLAKGTFRFPATLVGNSVELDRATLMMILEGVDLKSARRQKRYRHGEPNAPTGSATSPWITH